MRAGSARADGNPAVLRLDRVSERPQQPRFRSGTGDNCKLAVDEAKVRTSALVAFGSLRGEDAAREL